MAANCNNLQLFTSSKELQGEEMIVFKAFTKSCVLRIHSEPPNVSTLLANEEIMAKGFCSGFHKLSQGNFSHVSPWCSDQKKRELPSFKQGLHFLVQAVCHLRYINSQVKGLLHFSMCLFCWTARWGAGFSLTVGHPCHRISGTWAKSFNEGKIWFT